MRDGVLDANRLVEVGEGNDVQYGREGFALHDGHRARGAQQCGFDEVARPLQCAAAMEQTRALCLGRRDCFEMAVHGGAVDQGAHERVSGQRIAAPYLPVGADQSPLQFRLARPVHQHAPRRGAALARRADGAEHERGHREVEIRALIDDHGVVAAEFQEAAAEAGGDAHADLAPDVRGTGEGDECHPPIVDECGCEFGAGVDEHLEDRRQGVAFEHPCADALHGDGAKRRLR